VIAVLLQDARAALRLMRRQASFSMFVVLTLALGIGAATSVFTLVQAVLLRDLSFADPTDWSGCTTCALSVTVRLCRFLT
jgi:macrolide transport system ATP-binding/permease protein